MFQDILSESWVYREIVEQGVEKGREEGKIQGQREILIGFVQRHFPEITALAEQQAAKVTDSEMLQTVILKLLDARMIEEARQILLSVDKSGTKH